MNDALPENDHTRFVNGWTAAWESSTGWCSSHSMRHLWWVEFAKLSKVRAVLIKLSQSDRYTQLHRKSLNVSAPYPSESHDQDTPQCVVVSSQIFRRTMETISPGHNRIASGASAVCAVVKICAYIQDAAKTQHSIVQQMTFDFERPCASATQTLGWNLNVLLLFPQCSAHKVPIRPD
jgi:hypothetical protein